MDDDSYGFKMWEILTACVIFGFTGFLVGGGIVSSGWEIRVVKDGAYEWRIDSKTGERRLSPIHVEPERPTPASPDSEED